jgi:alpha-tubulin suppressor-like RCC1 family protein
LNNNGEIYSCGDGLNGQLGLGVNRKELFPKKVSFPDKDTKITGFKAGNNHSLFLDSNGDVYSCGLNDLGQLGIENIRIALTPQKIPSL